jgi:WD repeat-containing protein 68
MSADKKEIYTYEAPWNIYGMNWSNRPSPKFRLAVGSFLEDYKNAVDIIQLEENDHQNNHNNPNTNNSNPNNPTNQNGKFHITASFLHPYPTTKIMFSPDRSNIAEDLIATSGDYLRLWKIDPSIGATAEGNHTKMVSLLSNSKSSEFCAPLTSFDWNETDPSIVGTSSIDTTCTIWNIQTGQAKTQLIAHDKEVYDLAFAPSADIFASAGADGSVRMFDLRSLEHSTIIYESNDFVPLLRVIWNKHNSNYLATFLMDQNSVIILDTRSPSVPLAELTGHNACVNSIAWAPHSDCHICTGGDDCQALIWDLTPMPKPISEPILAYNAEGEINTLQWSAAQPEWVAITFNKKLQILRV